MMKYNEWKLIQESVAPTLTLGLKSRHNLGFINNLQEFENPHKGKDEDDEDEDGDGSDLEDDDMLDGDIMGAGDDEGGPAKSFPPDDSEDMGGGDEMDSVLGGIDPDLAGLGDDDPVPGMGGMGGLGGGKGGKGAPALGPELTAGADLGGPEMGGLGGPEMGGPEMGDDMGGEMGEPCPDCNPDGAGEPDPHCPMCQGIGFLPDDMGGEDLGQIGDEEMAPDIKKMNFMDMMRAYQKKYMGAGTTPTAPGAGMAPATKMAPMMGRPKFMAKAPVAPKFMNKGMAPMQHHKGMHPQHVKHCGTCENVAGTYAETDADFLASLTHNVGSINKRWDSGFREDALVQAVDNAYAPKAPEAGEPGFAPQGRVGGPAIGGGGYNQQDINQIPVLESRRYPTLDQYVAARKTKKR